MSQTGNTVVIDNPEGMKIELDGIELHEICYGIMAVNPDWRDNVNAVRVLHFTGFQFPPTEEDFNGLKKQLEFDEVYGLTATEFELLPAPGQVINAFVEAAKKISGPK